MSARTIISKLRQLAADPHNRHTIVHEQACLPSIILFLDNNDSQVVTLALEALEFLAACPTNKDIMVRELGLIVSLDRIIAKGSPADRDICKKIKQSLQQRKAPQPLQQTNSQRSSVSHAFFSGNANKKARSIVLQFRPFEKQELRATMEEALLDLTGVISFTFDADSLRITIRVRQDLENETLFRSLLRIAGLKFQQVLRDENGREELIDPISAKENGSTRGSGYLDDEDDTQTDKSKALTSAGYSDSRDGSSWGWFGSFGKLVAKPFFW